MTTSVCMGIYNGEKYIEEQMVSILRQTKRADEVILCDDNSSDKTAEIVRRFIEENDLGESWKLYCNRENKGYPGNFHYAMSLCTKDIVFLSDQDDVWDESKMERMCGVLERNREARAVCCKFGLIDGEGRSIHTMMAPTRGRDTGALRGITVEDVFYKCEWPGMVTAYRNAWYEQWIKDLAGRGGEEEFCRIPHDFLICAGAAEEGGFLQMDEKLAFHRRHGDNAGGEEHRLRKLLNKERKLGEIKAYLDILQAFERGKVLRTKRGKRVLRQKLRSMQGRYDALRSEKISRVIRNAWKNRTNTRPATVACDLLIVRQKG